MYLIILPCILVLIFDNINVLNKRSILFKMFLIISHVTNRNNKFFLKIEICT
jgi:hypothetical protein